MVLLWTELRKLEGVITLLFHALYVNIVNSIYKCERCEGGAL